MKTTKKSIVLMAALLLLGISNFAQGYGEIRGIIKDTELEPVPFAKIKVVQGNLLIGGTQADDEGRYHYKPLNPGIYEIVVMDPGHQTQPVNKINVKPNEATYVDVKLAVNSFSTIEVIAAAIDYAQTGVDKTMFTMVSIDARELNRMAGYTPGDVKNSLELVTSDAINTGDGEVHFRGSRGDANGYFVDGVRTLKPITIPGLSIDNLTVFSGGVPASYGDVTSGVVIITTKSYFSGIRDKNMRISAQREREAEVNAKKKAEMDEENRKKEIEAEKLKEKLEKEKGTKQGGA
jgi:hypothetical protein